MNSKVNTQNSSVASPKFGRAKSFDFNRQRRIFYFMHYNPGVGNYDLLNVFCGAHMHNAHF